MESQTGSQSQSGSQTQSRSRGQFGIRKLVEESVEIRDEGGIRVMRRSGEKMEVERRS